MISQRLVAISDPLREPIAPAFVTAMALHAIVFLAVGFGVAWPRFESESIAVTVVLTPANQAPTEASHVAAQDQMGEEEAAEPPTPVAQLQLQTTMTISRELDGADGALASPPMPLSGSSKTWNKPCHRYRMPSQTTTRELVL